MSRDVKKLTDPAIVKLTEIAHAKLNLCLAVHFPPQKGGYHLLDSVFQEISLSDFLTFSIVDAHAAQDAITCTSLGSDVLISCNVKGLKTTDNLIFRAIDALEQTFNTPVCGADEMLIIDVDKHIPAGGGLGGGSSNAAAAIRAYCKICNKDIADKRAMKVAQNMGADVAFFLHGGTALMCGRGDELVRKLPSFPLPLVLIGSNKGCNTGAVYRAFDANPTPAPDAEMLAEAMEEYAKEKNPLAKAVASMMLAKRCQNNLSLGAYKQLPELEERIRRANASNNTLCACVTGSGATAFAVCANKEAAERFAEEAALWCDWTRVVEAL